MTRELYNAIENGYLPPPERGKGQGQRWLWRYPSEFEAMSEFYLCCRHAGLRGNELHFAMWWHFGWWHEGAKAYVVHITTCFHRAAALILKKQKQAKAGDKVRIADVLRMLYLMGLPFRGDVSADDLDDLVDELYGVLVSGEPADEKTRRLCANWLVQRPYRDEVAQSETFKQLHRITMLKDAAQKAGRDDYEHTRAKIIEIFQHGPFSLLQTLPGYDKAFIDIVYETFSAWLCDMRSTEGRYLRPLKRAPDLALWALLLANILDIQTQGKA
jgi:hypothetical protein